MFNSQWHRWWIPLASCASLFYLLAFLIPYSSSVWEKKESIAGLIYIMAASPDERLDFTYCFFVLPIIAYLVYLSRKDLQKAKVSQSNVGLVFMIFGVLFYWFGLRAENQYFGYAGLQTLLAGSILWLWGWEVFRILLFPLAFLTFVWPMPFLDSYIALPLRLVMSTTAAYILPGIGIPCLQSGTALLSPGDVLHDIPAGSLFQIDIADPCSGIRSLFALLMFSALFGYLFVPRLWQQWLIFLCAFPLAILGNLARVIMLVIGSILFGSAFAIGTSDQPSAFHEGCGFLVYAVALGAEYGIAILLTRKWKRADDYPLAEQIAV